VTEAESSRAGRLLRGRGWHAWVRRGVLVGVLAAAAFAPGGQSSGASSPACGDSACRTAGSVLWTTELPGTWTAASDLPGTVPTGLDGGQAYAAAGGRVVALSLNMVVYCYSARTGAMLWLTGLTGFPVGSQIVSVRVWSGVVTAGVATGPLMASGSSQSTVVLSAASGRQLHSYPSSAPFGGAVAASARDTVVVGPAAVTSYDNATGRALWSRALWSRATGSDVQEWRSDGGHLYVAMADGGYLSPRPATSLLRISLQNGAEQVVRPQGGSFGGRLAAVLRGVVLFSGADGVTAYSGITGRLLWRLAGAIPESADLVRGVFYVSIGGTLTGVQSATGRIVAKVTGAEGSGTSGVYGVRGGVALGLDLGSAGDAWGYDVSSQRVIWTTRGLPWPHFFVDLSGIGGSANPDNSSVLLTTCPQRVMTYSGPVCQKADLVLIDR
jgi:PQQ-like domain